MRVLVAGATGLAGAHVVEHLTIVTQGKVAALSSQGMDLRNPRAVEEVVAALGPDAVVNCAAYANADRAEDEPDAAKAVNEIGAGNLARAARAVGARLIHVSTNFVYPDVTANGLIGEVSEVDLPTERRRLVQGAYAVSKYLGDLRVLHDHPANIVLRTTSIYGPHGGNYVSKVARMILEGQSPMLDPERVVSPTSGYALARCVGALLLDPTLKELRGVVHFRCAGKTTWAAWGRHLAQYMGCAPALVQEFLPPYRAPRPKNLLGLGKLQAAGYSVPTWEEAAMDAARAELAAWSST